MPLPQEAVLAVISACRSDDIYHQVSQWTKNICGFQEHACMQDVAHVSLTAS